MRNALVFGADNSANFSEQNPKYPDLLAKYGDILRNPKVPLDSPQFKQAFNALLHDLVQKAQETGDTKDATFFIEKSHQTGLISPSQYVDLTRKLAEFAALNQRAA